MTDFLDEMLKWASAKEGAKVALIGQVLGDTTLSVSGIRMLEETGSLGVFAACIGWAAIIEKQANLTPSRDGGFIGFKVAEIDTDTGNMRTIEPEDTDPDFAPAMWAIRFVTAHVNGDLDVCTDLFKGCPPDRIGMNVMGLLELCASHVRPLLHDGDD